MWLFLHHIFLIHALQLYIPNTILYIPLCNGCTIQIPDNSLHPSYDDQVLLNFKWVVCTLCIISDVIWYKTSYFMIWYDIYIYMKYDIYSYIRIHISTKLAEFTDCRYIISNSLGPQLVKFETEETFINTFSICLAWRKLVTYVHQFPSFRSNYRELIHSGKSIVRIPAHDQYIESGAVYHMSKHSLPWLVNELPIPAAIWRLF